MENDELDYQPSLEDVNLGLELFMEGEIRKAIDENRRSAEGRPSKFNPKNISVLEEVFYEIGLENNERTTILNRQDYRIDKVSAYVSVVYPDIESFFKKRLDDLKSMNFSSVDELKSKVRILRIDLLEIGKRLRHARGEGDNNPYFRVTPVILPGYVDVPSFKEGLGDIFTQCRIENPGNYALSSWSKEEEAGFLNTFAHVTKLKIYGEILNTKVTTSEKILFHEDDLGRNFSEQRWLQELNSMDEFNEVFPKARIELLKKVYDFVMSSIDHYMNELDNFKEKALSFDPQDFVHLI